MSINTMTDCEEIEAGVGTTILTENRFEPQSSECAAVCISCEESVALEQSEKALEEIVFDLVSLAEASQMRLSDVEDMDLDYDDYTKNALRMKLGFELQKDLFKLLTRAQRELFGLGN